jgi:hypothetical protein
MHPKFPAVSWSRSTCRHDRISGASCPGQSVTDAMLTKLSPPGTAFRPWLLFRRMTPRIRKE